jgi:hypothetical protein
MADEVVESKQSQDEQTQEPDTSYLVFKISQDTYDNLQDLVLRAEERGLNTDATYWLENMFNKHAKVQNGLWDKADDVETYNQAVKGNTKSLRALLGKLGANSDTAVEAIMKQIRASAKK